MQSHRAETEPKRSNNPGPTKTRTITTNWNQMPHWALLGARDVRHLTGLSNTALNCRLKECSFPVPSKHGKDRVWSLGQVREWCRSITGESA